MDQILNQNTIFSNMWQTCDCLSRLSTGSRHVVYNLKCKIHHSLDVQKIN